MSSEVSLLVELYNPLYLFPIVAVVFTALMVYAFGFKSSAQPPTEVVDALNDRHHKNYKTSHELVKRKKQTPKSSSLKSEPKTQPNGHITSESSRPSEKKTPKKVTEQAAVPKVPTPKPSGKRQKNKKAEENDVEVEDKDGSGEWVELISKKERKNRKQKEEQLLMEAKDSKTNREDKTLDKSKKTSKKSKPQKNEEPIEVTKNPSPKTNKETIEVMVNQNTDTNSAKKQNGVNSVEEIAPDRDVPDIYGLAKEQRLPKKAQKQRNTKRNSESEINSRAEPSPENEPKPNLNLSDKLTAAIVANYEGNDNKVENVSNKKKKEKNKKKASQQQTQTNTEINGKQVSISERNEENKASNELVVENSNQDIPNVAEVKSSEEDEFKVVNKKRRPRRE